MGKGREGPTKRSGERRSSLRGGEAPGGTPTETDFSAFQASQNASR